MVEEYAVLCNRSSEDVSELVASVMYGVLAAAGQPQSTTQVSNIAYMAVLFEANSVHVVCFARPLACLTHRPLCPALCRTTRRIPFHPHRRPKPSTSDLGLHLAHVRPSGGRARGLRGRAGDWTGTASDNDTACSCKHSRRRLRSCRSICAGASHPAAPACGRMRSAHYGHAPALTSWRWFALICAQSNRLFFHPSKHLAHALQVQSLSARHGMINQGGHVANRPIAFAWTPFPQLAATRISERRRL